MDDLLTTKQLKDLLQVDRITIYRMLHDGRLRGFKVGGQWRFSRREIDAWLREQQVGLGSADVSPPQSSPEVGVQALPLACLQAIQDVCAEALDLGAVTTDLDGIPLTQISNSCDFCNLILSSDNGKHHCRAAWRRTASGEAHACHAGLLCINAPVRLGGERIAIASVCQFRVSSVPGSPLSWEADVPTLAFELGLDPDDLRAASDSVKEVGHDSLARVARLLFRVAETYSEIGHERLSLLSRLQHIAEITKV
ncbi:PocR ligand-binding domain-containing protein [Chloroflexota bacterium]